MDKYFQLLAQLKEREISNDETGKILNGLIYTLAVEHRLSTQIISYVPHLKFAEEKGCLDGTCNIMKHKELFKIFPESFEKLNAIVDMIYYLQETYLLNTL